MLQLFEPQSKVQKDRVVLKETDMRMAKYSRRGIITNFLIYCLCLLFEQQFIKQHPKLALVLTGGLLLTTGLRGYFLFRMDSIYPRGPAAWRNRYFLATLLGAAWWSLILCTLTLVMDMQGEAALMWLYTVVFFSTTAHAFAPYSRFCRTYQLMVLVPASLCTFLIGDVIGVFYGAILLFFCYLLTHHSQLMAENYWDRLDAQLSLARKTESLEEEKRDTRASVQLINQYMEQLSSTMRSLLHGAQANPDSPPPPVTVASQRTIFEKIYRNVDDFQRILSKEIEINSRIFNVRHFLQALVHRYVESAEKQGIELEVALSPALPARLFGDAAKVGQIVNAMVETAIEQTQEGLIFVEVEFLREYETSGELHITIARQGQNGGKKAFFAGSSDASLHLDLNLVLVKGLADALGGELELNELLSSDGKDMRFRIPLALAELDARADYHRLEYRGKPILLVHPNARWLDHKRLELDAMGFSVQTANSFKKALHTLQESLNKGAMIESLMYYSPAGEDHSVQFCNELLSHAQLKYIHQFVICSRLGRQYFSDRVLQQSPLLHYVEKPCGVFEFEIAFNLVFDYIRDSAEDDDEHHQRREEFKTLWVALGKNFDHSKLYENDAMRVLKVGDLKQLTKAMEAELFDLAVVECTENNDYEGINAIRYFESNKQRETLVPVVGVGPSSAGLQMLEHGVDHFIDIESLVGGDTRELRFWASGRHH